MTPTVIGPGIRLTLSPNQSGSAQITLRATDGSGLAVTGSFVLTVNPVNDAPVTVADTYTVPQRGTLIANDPRGTNNANPNDNGVLANDSDIEGTSMTATIVTQPTFGTITFNANGTFTYVHTGATRATDTFTYRASDGSANSTETTVTITVGAPTPPTHQNAVNQFDVNADGFISAIDALLIINRLNINGPGPVSGLTVPPPYLDVSGDNQISAIDALLVINRLNSGGNAEGESSSDFDALAAASTFQYCVSRVSDNQSVGFAAMPVITGEVYGPEEAHELGLAAALNELEAGDGDLAYGWPDVQSSDVRHEANDEALGSLWADFPSQNRK